MTKLFDPVAQSEVPQSSNNQEEVKYFEALVGEGKKYKDVEALAKSRVEADRHVATLEDELRKERAEKESRMSIEKFYQMTRAEKNEQTPVVSNQQTPPVDERTSNQSSQLTQQDIMKIVENALQDRSAKASREQNIAEARKYLIDKFGQNLDKVVSHKAQELGVTTEFLEDLASKSPKALMSLLAREDTKIDNSFVPPGGSVRTTVSSGDSGNTGPRTEQYYEKLRKSNPRLYWNSETQYQMHKDAVRLGEKFFQ